MTKPNITASDKTCNYTIWDIDGGDENVDVKATRYISLVRERFKLESANSSGKVYEEML